ncbi:MAG TPA: hypothetical protein VM695_04575 [Phycisphaerae bacterium]|nr:hypothetical protein [Phycisphaerae bacterium]
MSTKAMLSPAVLCLAAGSLPSLAAGAGPEKPAPAPAGAKEPGVSFLADVSPVLSRLGCNAAACHGASQGRGGLRLSLFGAYPQQDHTAVTREARGRRINPVEPRRSLFLLKAAGAVAHEGGKKAPAKKAVPKTSQAAIRLAAEEPAKGITVRATPIAAGKDEATVTLRVPKQFAVGYRQNLILAGTMKLGKDTLTAYAPAVAIEVVPEKPAAKAPTPAAKPAAKPSPPKPKATPKTTPKKPEPAPKPADKK